ncbi:hypothetical protein [Microbispora sp. NBRC 16548]|uniref:hypothetical protein n=1 Tax=Microbispora sp. NBRC 16548 TaxID=3030994 RepID=UPI0024A0AB61|nr:hypothetical protein [Microbispora sp. NBRC 16548]GLX09278.1 hypothetical protein Misp03_62040 [Microbispora sp. NBRC 16548]
MAVEVPGTVTHKPYPKSKAGRREVPLPPFVVELLAAHRERYPAGPVGEVFTNAAGGPLRRTLFRARDWRPSLVRAGLLGKVVEAGPNAFLGVWQDKEGLEHRQEFPTHREAVAHVAKHAAEGLRFHDLHHCSATWLVSDGVPVNDVARLRHEQMSTTLNRSTYSSRDRYGRARAVCADSCSGPAPGAGRSQRR